MKFSNTKNLLLASVAIGAASVAAPAWAQDDAAEDDEGIIIVQGKRGATDLSSTAGTVNVITADDLKNREIRSPEDLRTAVSGVYIDEGSSTPRIAIRGVGFDNFQIQAENGVTTYMDGVVIQRTQAVLGAFNDLAQIDVLKGPQGSAFGRNATGGSINLITQKPEEGFSGEIGVTYGSFDRIKAGGVLNYGSDVAGIRVSGFYEDQDGYYTNTVTGNRLGGKEQIVFRTVANAEPTDNLSLTYTMNYTDTKGSANGNAYTTQAAADFAASYAQIFPGQFTSLLPAGQPVTEVADDRYVVANRIDPFNENQSFFHALNAELDLGGVTLKSTTGLIFFDSNWGSDVSAPTAFAEGLVSVPRFEVGSTQFSQEFLLNGESDFLDWVVGAYYLTERVTDQTDIIISSLAVFGAVGLPVGTTISIDNGQKLESYAFFADGQFNLTDSFRLNAGLRWTSDQKEAFGTGQTIDVAGGGFFIIPGASLDGISVKSDKLTWQFGLEYDFTDDVFGYARVARGFKAGGINNNDGLTYQPETLDSYEIGVRADLYPVNFALSAFYNKYKDIQVFTAPPGAAVPVILNAASGTIAGLDFEGSVEIVEGLSIDTRITWMPEAEYDAFVATDPLSATPADYSGQRLNRSPEFTGVFGINYDSDVSDMWSINARAELYTTSSIAFNHNALLRPAELTQSGYSLINLNFGVTYDDRIDLRFYGKNIGNQFYLTTIVEGSCVTTLGCFQYGSFGRPDEWGAELRFRF